MKCENPCVNKMHWRGHIQNSVRSYDVSYRWLVHVFHPKQYNMLWKSIRRLLLLLKSNKNFKLAAGSLNMKEENLVQLHCRFRSISPVITTPPLLVRHCLFPPQNLSIGNQFFFAKQAGAYENHKEKKLNVLLCVTFFLFFLYLHSIFFRFIGNLRIIHSPLNSNGSNSEIGIVTVVIFSPSINGNMGCSSINGLCLTSGTSVTLHNSPHMNSRRCVLRLPQGADACSDECAVRNISKSEPSTIQRRLRLCMRERGIPHMTGSAGVDPNGNGKIANRIYIMFKQILFEVCPPFTSYIIYACVWRDARNVRQRSGRAMKAYGVQWRTRSVFDSKGKCRIRKEKL